MARPRRVDFQTVVKIRELYATGKFTVAYLARLFRLSAPTISNIIDKKGTYVDGE